MTAIDATKDTAALTMTITSRFDANTARVWQVWADSRQLECWWGPPTYPATVVEHDLRSGGRVTYFMTGPQGDRHHGWWIFREINEPASLQFENGFADDAGTPSPGTPITIIDVTLIALSSSQTGMRVTTTFPSSEIMEQLITMAMLEGMTLAIGQIPELLANRAGTLT